MDKLDVMTDSGGLYPIAFDRRWHTGLHLVPSSDRSLPVRAIADGDVVAYGAYQRPVFNVCGDRNTNAGFVLLKHTTETGENRVLTFYSLYMHLLDLDSMTHDGIQPPPVDVPHSMPAWLREDTGGPVSGGDKKVRRKDILGYTGQCQSNRHLHFEIFMAPDDFDAYFGATQLGHRSVETPQGSDCWGHCYYVIPAGETFRAQPPGVDERNKLRGIQFGPKQGGQNEHPLYVEVYFHKGNKYTNVWSVAADGSWTLLTERDPDSGQPLPVCEATFEYDMYKRASALYATCASDGYELLRFGRILSQPATLPPTPDPDQDTSATPNPRATWYCIPFARGQQGYIDISKPSIKKVSDADFPFFMGWQKIQGTTAPVDENGLWDLDKFKELVRASIGETGEAGTDAEAAQQTTGQKNEAFQHYISDPGHKAVRELLHGFICEAPSEWDSANLDSRYRNLLGEGEHFEGDQDAYNKFLDFVKKLQFWDKTGFPAGGKVWFFHPLAFIRNFRKSPWLSQEEFERIYSKNRYRNNQNPTPSQLRSKYLVPLNVAIRKYGLTSPARLAHFLGQGAVESAWLTSMQETSMLGRIDKSGFHGTVTNPASKVEESTLGHWYGQLPTEDDAWFRSVKFNSHGTRITGSYDWRNGNCDREDAQKFRGRGFKQLTGRSNYANYFVFRGWVQKSSFSDYWWADKAFLRYKRSEMTKIPAEIENPQWVALPENCIDSGGFYLRGGRPQDVAKKIDLDTPEVAVSPEAMAEERNISREVTYAINGGYTDDERRLQYTRAAKEILS
ncbi:M23 family metallopeptidase [Burkholderia ubonensis]|uniref:M23 family metallopeptidase n=1 Tax=Burkholderia ubonensis TaxID=101571 RepID=UPI000A7CC0C8|nr:M23 family metallopeptidase [Burkholderia ubonensis]